MVDWGLYESYLVSMAQRTTSRPPPPSSRGGGGGGAGIISDLNDKSTDLFKLLAAVLC